VIFRSHHRAAEDMAASARCYDGEAAGHVRASCHGPLAAWSSRIDRHRHGARAPVLAKIPGDDTEWYQCGNPDEFTFMNQGDTLSPTRSPYMKEQIVINGAYNESLWQGNCDVGELTSLGSHRMNAVGRILRQIYVDELHFLPEFMDSKFQISHTYIW